MLLNNLPIKYQGQENDKIIFQTKSGEKIFVTTSLLGEKLDKGIDYYISLGTDTQNMSEEDRKKILNDLIGDDVKG